jgi:2-dehydro-3-deoxygluconokinase
MPFDVITFGEAMVRLSPSGFRRLEQARSLDVFVGGAELNTAVGLAKLGRRTDWVSRLTRNSLGRLIANHAREAGVGVEHICWTDEDRVGVYFVEFGAAPRASNVLYDRRDSAVAKIRTGEVDWPALFAGAKWFHVTGITPALSQTAAEVTREALQAARRAGVQVSIDLNYRAKLWDTGLAGRWLAAFMSYCDVLIATEEDLERVFSIREATIEDAAKRAARQFELKTVAVSIRDNPLVWKNTWTGIALHEGGVFRTRSYEVEIVDRLGAGDSFAAGLIHGLLDADVQKGLDYAVAASALKHSIPGDFNWSTLEEVEALLKGQGLRIVR